MQAAVDAAKEAFRSWSHATVLTRQQCMFKYQDLIKKNMVCPQPLFPSPSCSGSFISSFSLLQDRLAKSITLEQGKTFDDARGDVMRGLRR